MFRNSKSQEILIEKIRKADDIIASKLELMLLEQTRSGTEHCQPELCTTSYDIAFKNGFICALAMIWSGNTSTANQYNVRPRTSIAYDTKTTIRLLLKPPSVVGVCVSLEASDVDFTLIVACKFFSASDYNSAMIIQAVDVAVENVIADTLTYDAHGAILHDMS